MEHIQPGILEPFQEIIANLITLPQKIGAVRSHPPYDKPPAAHETADTDAAANTAQAAYYSSAGRIHRIPVDSILPPKGYPQRMYDDPALHALAESIGRHGILQPLTVRLLETTPADGDIPRYEILAGARRLRAAYAVHRETVPCIVFRGCDLRAEEIALLDNIRRGSLDMFEEAGALSALLDLRAMTREEIARALSCSLSSVANKLRILRLTESEREIILRNHLSERHARTLLRIRDLDTRIAAAQYIAEQALSVAGTEAYIDRFVCGETISTPCEEVRTAQSAVGPAAAAQVTAPPVLPPRGKPIIKDLRLFYNTVDRALSILQAAGIRTSREMSEENGTTVLRISITHS